MGGKSDLDPRLCMLVRECIGIKIEKVFCCIFFFILLEVAICQPTPWLPSLVPIPMPIPDDFDIRLI